MVEKVAISRGICSCCLLSLHLCWLENTKHIKSKTTAVFRTGGNCC